MRDALADRLFGRSGDDPGCDGCLERVHVWAEAVAAGVPGDIAQPQVALHLRNCSDCAGDAEALLQLLWSRGSADGWSP